MENCCCKVLFAGLLEMNSQLSHVPVTSSKCLGVIKMHVASPPAWSDPALFIFIREKLLESMPEESMCCVLGTFMVICNCFTIKKSDRRSFKILIIMVHKNVIKLFCHYCVIFIFFKNTHKSLPTSISNSNQLGLYKIPWALVIIQSFGNIS